MLESAAAEQAIYLLIDNAAITGLTGIYSGMSKEASTRPCVIFQQATSTDWTCNDRSSMGMTFQYLVEVFADGETFPHGLAAQVHNAINNQSATITVSESGLSDTDWIVDIIRVRSVSNPDEFQGHEIRKSGGLYRVTVRSAA